MPIQLFQKKKPVLFDVPEYDHFRMMLERNAAEHGDAIAVKYKTKSTRHDVTYTELLAKVNSLLTGMGSIEEPPRRVAVAAQEGFPYVLTLTALLSSDAVAVPLDPSLPLTERIGMIRHSDCDTVVIDRAELEAFREQRALTPQVKHLICIGLREHEEDRDRGLYSFSALMERGQSALDEEGADPFAEAVLSRDDDRLLLYKSAPADSFTAAVFTQGALIAAVRGFLQLNDPGQRCLSVMPLDHPYELVCCILASFWNHATVCLNSGLKAFQKELAEYAPDYMMLPPLYVENIWQKLVRTFESGGQADTFRTLVKTGNALRKIGIDRRRVFFSKIHDVLGGNLKKIFVGGALINPDAVRFFEDVGVSVYGSYGTLECCCLISAARDDTDPETAGALLPCLQIKINEPDEAGTGEICVMGDSLMRRYYKNDEKTASVIDPAGWFHTGDVGQIDAAGTIRITGKIKKGINLKIGRSVDPEEIESYLISLPFIREAKVYAGKDARGAELHLCADLWLDEGQFENMSPAERTAAVREKIDRLNAALPPYKRVKTLHVRKDAPKAGATE